MGTGAWYRTEINLNFSTKKASLYVYNTSDSLIISRTNQSISNDNINRIIHYAAPDSNTSSPIYYDNLIVRKNSLVVISSTFGLEE